MKTIWNEIDLRKALNNMVAMVGDENKNKALDLKGMIIDYVNREIQFKNTDYPF